MKRLIMALLVGGALFGTVFGLAEGLQVTSGALQSGSDADLRCDQDGVNVNFGPDPGFPKTQANLSNVAFPDCQGEEILVEVLDEDGNVLASGSGSVTASAFSVTLDDPLALEEVDDAEEVRGTIVS